MAVAVQTLVLAVYRQAVVGALLPIESCSPLACPKPALTLQMLPYRLLPSIEMPGVASPSRPVGRNYGEALKGYAIYPLVRATGPLPGLSATVETGL